MVAMKKLLKWAFRVIGGLIVLWLAVFLGQFAYFSATAPSKRRAVNKMCEIKPGTPVEEVIPIALSLGFTKEKHWALISGIWVMDTDSQPKQSMIEWNDPKLPGMQSGTIALGKLMFPPFGRLFCNVQFKNRVVTSAFVTSLD